MVSKTGVHALRAVAVLAGLPPGEYMGAAAIAGRIGAPPNYLGKLLQTLSHHDLVEGQKGLRGGFRLARHAGDITLMDVVDPIDHVSRWNGCFLGNDDCGSGEPCPVHVQWAGVRDSYLDFLRTTVIRDIGEGMAEGWVRL
jgi:Rrf2 family protein